MKFYKLDEITSMLDEIHDACDNEPIEEVDIVQIGDVLVDRVGLKDQWPWIDFWWRGGWKCIGDLIATFGNKKL